MVTTVTEPSKAAHNKGFAKYGRQNIALKTLVILIGFCTLAVVNQKLRPSQRQEF